MSKREREPDLPSPARKSLHPRLTFHPLTFTTASGDTLLAQRIKDLAPTNSDTENAPATAEEPVSDKNAKTEEENERMREEFGRLLEEIKLEDAYFESAISRFRTSKQSLDLLISDKAALETRLKESQLQYEVELKQENELCEETEKNKGNLEEKIQFLSETKGKLEQKTGILNGKIGETRLKMEILQKEKSEKEAKIGVLMEEVGRKKTEIVKKVQETEDLSVKVAEEAASLEGLRREIEQYGSVA